MLFMTTGSWKSPSTFQINVQGNVGAKPPEIGHLTVMTLEAGDIRNKPPQSSATVGVYSPPLDGNFGPSSMRIIAFTAHDPLNSANVVRTSGLFSMCHNSILLLLMRRSEFVYVSICRGIIILA